MADEEAKQIHYSHFLAPPSRYFSTQETEQALRLAGKPPIKLNLLLQQNGCTLSIPHCECNHPVNLATILLIKTHREARLENTREAVSDHLLTSWKNTKASLTCDGCGKAPPDSVNLPIYPQICSLLDDIEDREKQDLKHTLDTAFFVLQLPQKKIALCPDCRDKHLWVAHQPGAWRVLRPHYSIVADSFGAHWSVNHKNLLSRALLGIKNEAAWYTDLLKKAKQTAYAKWSLQVLDNLLKIGIERELHNTPKPEKYRLLEKSHNLPPTRNMPT